jgi:hypothetical protein
MALHGDTAGYICAGAGGFSVMRINVCCWYLTSRFFAYLFSGMRYGS